MANLLVQIYIPLLPGQEGEELFRTETNNYYEDGNNVTKTTTYVPSCVNGCVIHNEIEYGGKCTVCRTPLCKEHSKIRCQYDGNLLCDFHASRNNLGNYACSSHGKYRRFMFHLRGR